MGGAWSILILAGLLEICWAIGLKYSEGFSKFWPSLFTVGTLLLSTYFLAKAIEQLPVGTAYAIWVGIGAAGAAALGIILFKEPVSLLRLGFILLLIISIIGLKLTSNH